MMCEPFHLIPEPIPSRKSPGPWHADKVPVDTARLRMEMAAAGWKQDALARELGWDYTFIAQVLRRGFCNYYSLDRIACALGVHPESLIA